MIEMAKAKTNDKLDPNQLLKININAIRLINTMCPAEMLAYKRIINEKGLMNTPNNSMGASASFITVGTPGIQKMCFQ